MNAAIIGLFVLVFLLILSFVWTNNQFKAQKEKIEEINAKCLRSLNDTRIETIVDNMPQITLLKDSTSELQLQINSANQQVKKCDQSDKHIIEQIDKLGVEIKSITDRLITVTEDNNKKFESLNELIKQMKFNDPYNFAMSRTLGQDTRSILGQDTRSILNQEHKFNDSFHMPLTPIQHRMQNLDPRINPHINPHINPPITGMTGQIPPVTGITGQIHPITGITGQIPPVTGMTGQMPPVERLRPTISIPPQVINDDRYRTGFVAGSNKEIKDQDPRLMPMIHMMSTDDKSGTTSTSDSIDNNNNNNNNNNVDNNIDNMSSFHAKECPPPPLEFNFAADVKAAQNQLEKSILNAEKQ